MLLQILLLVVGFTMLVKGADWFVDGAAGVAGKMKIPALVIGLTVVAFGTSAPELVTSITSAFQKSVGIAIGNVLGSNICNILLILGLVLLSACGNRQVGIDTNQTFTKAYINIGGEWKTVTVKAWRDFQEGDEVQITTKEGVVYLTHYMNVVLVN